MLQGRDADHAFDIGPIDVDVLLHLFRCHRLRRGQDRHHHDRDDDEPETDRDGIAGAEK